MLQQLRIEGYFPLNSKRLQNTSNLHNAKRLRFECLEDRLPLTSIGLNFTAFTGTSSPIDVMGSVGLDHIAVQTNREFSVWDKDTGANLLTMTHDEFWSSALGIQPTLIRAFDPRIIYDHLTDRWFSVAGDRRPARSGSR